MFVCVCVNTLPVFFRVFVNSSNPFNPGCEMLRGILIIDLLLYYARFPSQ